MLLIPRALSVTATTFRSDDCLGVDETARSTNTRFNENLWLLYSQMQVVKVLDLGCSGGELHR
jgi:hypothetical protein